MLQLAIQNSGDVTTVWCRGRIVAGGHLNLLKFAAFRRANDFACEGCALIRYA